MLIYGKEGCGDCAKAKLLCEMKSVKFSYLTLGKDNQTDELHARVGSNVRSLPQIFINRDGQESHVGGYQEFRKAMAA